VERHPDQRPRHPALQRRTDPAALAEVLVSPEWLRAFEQDVAVPGEPLYTSKVLGQFPEDASTGTIPYSWLRSCIWNDPEDPGRPAPDNTSVELGVDVGASDNGDSTEIAERRGMRAGRFWSVRSGDPAVIRDRIVEAAVESAATRIKIDATGVGFGVVTLVQETGSPVAGSKRSPASAAFSSSRFSFVA